MARQAEAERERRAKIINAQGEFQAAQQVYEAAEVLSRNPTALQLRYLQTLLELGGEKSTIIFPLPMDLVQALSSVTPAHPSAGATKPASPTRADGLAGFDDGAGVDEAAAEAPGDRGRT